MRNLGIIEEGTVATLDAQEYVQLSIGRALPLHSPRSSSSWLPANENSATSYEMSCSPSLSVHSFTLRWRICVLSCSLKWISEM